MTGTILMVAPAYAATDMAADLSGGRIPWMAGSLLSAAAWTAMLTLLIFGPVATVSNYLIHNKLFVSWFVEPLVVLVVLCIPAIPIGMMMSGPSPASFLISLASLYLPTLIYYLLLRAIEAREHL